MLSRDSGLPLDTRNKMGTSGNVFESLPARGEPSSGLFENSKNFASSSCGLASWKRCETRSADSMPTPRFNQGLGTLNPLYHTGGIYSQNAVMDYPRKPISELLS